ncbi:MAG: 16S rRNA (cytosine(1402)-N(4))-methyltransferase [Chloroflexi bacterium RBG_16_56_11]|nr:MAG: 16S rRNA (cytosine(1402)-N(4))-methyltransferase [Chloroflexi bacterium RBG_16_56_11]
MVKKGLKSGHTPVLLAETLKALGVQPGGRYIDCTIGGGGHAGAILQQSSPGGQLLGIDADPNAIEIARERLQPYGGSVLLVNDNFVNLQSICIKYDFFPVHGILFDLGLSSLQLNGSGRGFSFQHDAPLDMRFNPGQKITAADIVNTTPETRLAHIIRTYGEELQSQRIARIIVRERPVKTTLQLAGVIEKAIGRRGRIHPATRTFQALRIAVNHELENLEMALRQAVDVLGYEGRLVVITYHSLEDRIVKQFMQKESRTCICPPETPVCVCGHVPALRIINKKVIRPTPVETGLNPRSRSAKLRAAERILNRDDAELAGADEGVIDVTRSPGWRRPVLLKKIRMAFLAA